jgi:Peptidase family M28
MTLEAPRSRLAGAAALLALAALVVLAWVLQRPPAPAPATVPPTEFSAERAYADLQRMAGPQPTPIGSAGSDAIRDHLVTALSAAGFRVEVQAGVGAQTFRSATVAGRVHNVVATLPGYDSTGQVVLMAHYDTTFGSPGASDDKSSVAAMLETARALGGKPLRNDVVMIFTDGEEAGLLGASSFVAERPKGDQIGVLLNWEATGNEGPSVLFETSSGNAELIKEFGASARSPIGDSALAALYQTSDQNTDFTPFRNAGFIGLNFALMDGTAAYHHIGDLPSRLDRAGLQHMGTNMLGLTRGFGERDLASLRSQQDAVFFSFFGQLVTYPISLVWPLAGLGILIVVVLAVLARRRREVTVPRMLAGAAAALLPIILAPLAAIGVWQLLIMIRPGYTALFLGDPYRPELYRWALGALTVTILLAWYLAFRRWIGATSLAIGALVWPAILGLVTAGLLPAMSYYGSLAAVTAGAGALIALLIRGRRPGWSVVALAVGAAPGVVILVLGGCAMLGVLGIANGAAAVFLFVLAGLLVLPLIELVLPARTATDAARPISLWRRLVVPIAALVMTLLLVGAGLAVDRFDQDHPRLTHLMYVMDADTGTAMWASDDQELTAWVAAYAPNANGNEDPPMPLPYRDVPRWLGTAPAIAADPPRIDLLESQSDGTGTVVKVRVTSPRAGQVVSLHVDRPVESTIITADGEPPATASPSYPDDAGTRPWPYKLRFYDPPREGFVVTMQLRGVGLPRIHVSDYTVGLEQVPGFTPRPADLARSPAHSSDIVVVGRTFRP